MSFGRCGVGIATAETKMSETARLRKLRQQPAHAERLLHALVVRTNLVPEGAHQIRNFASVPKELRIIAGLAATTNGHVWSCWSHQGRRWLFTGELSLPSPGRVAYPCCSSMYTMRRDRRTQGFGLISRKCGSACADCSPSPTESHPGEHLQAETRFVSKCRKCAEMQPQRGFAIASAASGQDCDLPGRRTPDNGYRTTTPAGSYPRNSCLAIRG